MHAIFQVKLRRWEICDTENIQFLTFNYNVQKHIEKWSIKKQLLLHFVVEEGNETESLDHNYLVHCCCGDYRLILRRLFDLAKDILLVTLSWNDIKHSIRLWFLSSFFSVSRSSVYRSLLEEQRGAFFRIHEGIPKSMSRKIILMWVRYASTDAYFCLMVLAHSIFFFWWRHYQI